MNSPATVAACTWFAPVIWFGLRLVLNVLISHRLLVGLVWPECFTIVNYFGRPIASLCSRCHTHGIPDPETASALRRIESFSRHSSCRRTPEISDRLGGRKHEFTPDVHRPVCSDHRLVRLSFRDVSSASLLCLQSSLASTEGRSAGSRATHSTASFPTAPKLG